MKYTSASIPWESRCKLTQGSAAAEWNSQQVQGGVEGTMLALGVGTKSEKIKLLDFGHFQTYRQEQSANRVINLNNFPYKVLKVMIYV